MSIFNGSKLQKKHLDIVIQEDAVYLLASTATDRIACYELITESWQSSLAMLLSLDLLRTERLSQYSARVVFSASYYQIYQIDKPELPRDEWSGALPFLLKDLISERISDIVVDAFSLSDERKVQAYVLNKRLILNVRAELERFGVTLARVLPEDEVWGNVQQRRSNFMLLYRAQQGDYRIGAFIHGKNRLQRTIRGITPPLIGETTSEQQLDSLALEVQRSADYLSSKLRDAPINHLLICCDQEPQDALLEALSERLSMSVQPLNTASEDEGKPVLLSGQVLCAGMAQTPESGINLYPNELKPQRAWLTLSNIIIAWSALALILSAITMYSNQRATALNHELHQLESEYSTLKQQQDDLKQRVVLHKPTQVKLDKLASLKRDNLIQKETLLSVNRFDKSEQIGYSSVIAALTAIESDDIRVIAVRLNGQGLSLRATASRASAIPAWLSQFKAAVSLVDKGFGRLAISRNHLEATNTGSVTFELTASEHEHQSSREMDNFILDDGGR